MKDTNGNPCVQLTDQFSLYFTTNNNFRILVNGKVHPLLCGIPSVCAAEDKLKTFRPGAVFANKEEFIPR